MTAWHGDLNLVYHYRSDTTLLTHTYAKAPLKIQRPFYPEGKEICHSVLLHTAGGVVGGDYLTQEIKLQPEAKTLLTTAAASKIYRSNGQIATQKITLQLDEGSCLEWLPQETIIFNGALYQQQIRVELARKATWIAWEITRLGRSARGERFLQGGWRSHTEVWREGYPIWIDRQGLVASEETLESYHGLNGYSVIASLICLGQPVERKTIDEIRLLRQNFDDPGEMGVSQTLDDGLLCRYRGHSTTQARQWLTSVWQHLRRSLLQRSPILPRVWGNSPH